MVAGCTRTRLAFVLYKQAIAETHPPVSPRLTGLPGRGVKGCRVQIEDDPIAIVRQQGKELFLSWVGDAEFPHYTVGHGGWVGHPGILGDAIFSDPNQKFEFAQIILPWALTARPRRCSH